jgi:cytoplasmic iron level regulating protein YaaA (DUF328/UPF0246 family)
MLIVISPAKTLDFENPAGTGKTTQPALLDRAAELVDTLRDYSPSELSRLMGISSNLGALNAERYAHWSRPFNASNAKQAIYAFRGDVYTGLDADSFTADQIGFAQQHLRILSGLYGVLRPLDLMQPYRLEMGTKLRTEYGRSLYDFWGDSITNEINRQLKKSKSKTLLNLASQEYFHSIRSEQIRAEIITPVFKDLKNGKYTIISFFAKKARGMMSGHAVRRQITDAAKLKRANVGGYRYDAGQSTDKEWVFVRDEP